jgi:hypothetical protein
MNRPANVQAFVSLIPESESSVLADTTERVTSASVLEAHLALRANIPPEIEELLCSAHDDLVRHWAVPAAEHVRRTKSEVPDTSYFLGVMRQETKAAAAAERLAAKGRSKSSKALQQDLPAEFEILTEAEDAVALVLRIYRDHVSAGEMKLLDSEDFGDLQSRDHTQCDILVEFFDLSIVLEEVLCVFQPYYTPFTTEEKDEIVDSLYVWLSTHADSLLDEHYHHDTNRIAAATLARINHSKTDTASEGASAKPTNFSVPFQQFRTWFLSASAAVSRYRETAEEGGV